MVTILAPTAATATVSGRVVNSAGRGIARAQITLTDTNGETHTALTNPFGYFRFDDVEAGQTYILIVRSKRYQFSNPTQVVFVSDEIADLNFFALP